ncbi:MAG: hypothetical protein C0512_04840 [Flavobacterium sp.]|nr:hypothetical protein [Flavobacterium sp.]
MKMYGWWRFFKKPGGLELAFLITRNLTLLPFFYFIFFESQAHFCDGMRFFFNRRRGFDVRVSNFGAG